MSELRYRRGAKREDLGENECFVKGVGGGLCSLVFRFRRVTDGKLETRTLPVRPNGQAGGAEHAWGLNRTNVPGKWQISPSIAAQDIVPDPDAPNGQRTIEVWHQTPAIVDVPEGEPWQ